MYVCILGSDYMTHTFSFQFENLTRKNAKKYLLIADTKKHPRSHQTTHVDNR